MRNVGEIKTNLSFNFMLFVLFKYFILVNVHFIQSD